jgi:hypothetical protein
MAEKRLSRIADTFGEQQKSPTVTLSMSLRRSSSGSVLGW